MCSSWMSADPLELMRLIFNTWTCFGKSDWLTWPWRTKKSITFASSFPSFCGLPTRWLDALLALCKRFNYGVFLESNTFSSDKKQKKKPCVGEHVHSMVFRLCCWVCLPKRITSVSTLRCVCWVKAEGTTSSSTGVLRGPASLSPLAPSIRRQWAITTLWGLDTFSCPSISMVL